MKKRCFKIYVLLMLLVLISGGSSISCSADYPNDMYVSVRFLSSQKVSLRWEKEKGIKYYKVVLRQYSTRANGTRSYKKKKTIKVKGTAKKCTLNIKANSTYTIKINGYNKKGKIIRTWEQDIDSTSAEPYIMQYYDEIYVSCFQPSSVTLFYTPSQDVGVPPSGVEIYRKEGNGRYQCIISRALKTSDIYLQDDQLVYRYCDTTVKTGKHYSYRIRFYNKQNKKKVYTGFSNEFSGNTVNSSFDLTMYLLTPIGQKTDSIILKLVSQKNNGDFSWGNLSFYNAFQLKSGQDFYNYEMEEILFSKDGRTWDSYSKSFVIKGGETIYMKVKPPKGCDRILKRAYFSVDFGYYSYEKTSGTCMFPISGTNIASKCMISDIFGD